MRKMVIAIVLSVCVWSVAETSSADMMILRDGTRVTGTVVGIAAQTITFQDTSGVSRRYSTDDVATLEFTPPNRRNARGSADRRSSTLLPSGTELVVRTVEEIDSDTAVADQIFSAIFEHDVAGRSGDVLVPEGSSAQLVIRDVSSGGATGSPEMVLDIQSITVGGRRYLVSTADLNEEGDTGIGQNRRTAETVGGGAVLGAIIGAIAGGGKGAAIGGVVGAAGGAGVQVLTKGKTVRVPAETVLKFRLDAPVSLHAER